MTTFADGIVVAILIWIVGGLLLCGAWMGFTIRGLVRFSDGKGRPFAPAMAQLSVVAMLIGLLRFGPTWGIGAVLFPPALLVVLPDIVALQITHQIALFAVPVTLLVLGVSLCSEVLRRFAILLASAALVATTLIAGEVLSSRIMCRTAAEQGLTEITRNSFRWSISNSGHEFQFSLHGMAMRRDQHFAWSYSEMDWYLLPDTIWPNVTSGGPTCRS